MKQKAITSVLIIVMLCVSQFCLAHESSEAEKSETYSYTEAIYNNMGWLLCMTAGSLAGAKAGTLILSGISGRASQYIFPCGERLQLSTITRRVFDIQLALKIEAFLLHGGAKTGAAVFGAIAGITAIEYLTELVKNQYNLLFIPADYERPPESQLRSNPVLWRVIGGFAGYIIGQYVDQFLQQAMIRQINDMQRRIIQHDDVAITAIAFRLIRADLAGAVIGFLIVDGENALVNFSMVATIFLFLWRRPYEPSAHTEILEVD